MTPRALASAAVTLGVIAGAVVGMGARQAPGAGAQPAPVTTGLILGQVVDAATGRPIPDAVVTLNMRALGAPARGQGAPAMPPTPPPAVLTSGDGRFLFHDLPKGPAQLTVNAMGYVPASAGQSRPSGPARPLELADGEHLTGVVLKVWRYASMSGTILDESGEPAVATTVRALRRVETAGRVQYNQSGSATTDDRGMYRFSQLVPGDYLVWLPETQMTMPANFGDSLIRSIASGAPGGEALLDLMSSGGAPFAPQGGTRIDDLLYSTDSMKGPAPRSDGRMSVYQTLFYPSASSANAATAIAIRSGDERVGVDMQLRLVSSARVSGVVTGPTGPMPGVSVRLVPTSADGPSVFDQPTATSTTRPDGTFTFLGVPPGTYLARVNKEPRPTLTGDAANNPLVQMTFGSAASTPPTGLAAMALYAAVPVTVSAADLTGVTVPLAPGARLVGHIVFQGTTPPPDLRAAQGFNVTVTSLEGAAGVIAGGQPNRADETGAFTTRGYPPGRYAIGATGNAGGAWMLSSITMGGRDVLDSGFDLRDADIADVVVTYADKIAQVSGTVHAAGGSPATSATVVVMPVGYRPGLIASGLSPRRARSLQAQKSGAYTVSALGAGDFVIAAFDDADAGDLQDAAFVATVLRVGTHASIAEGEKKSLDLTVTKVSR